MNVSILALTVTASAALVGGRFVTAAGAVPAAGANALGVVRSDAVIGEHVAVDVVGTAMVEAGAAIAAGAAVEVDSQGRAIQRTTGVIVGRMAPRQAAATAAGQAVEVFLIAN